MKFDISFLISGPGGQLWAPNRLNPVHADDCAHVVSILAQSMPDLSGIGATVIGVRVEPTKEANDESERTSG